MELHLAHAPDESAAYLVLLQYKLKKGESAKFLLWKDEHGTEQAFVFAPTTEHINMARAMQRQHPDWQLVGAGKWDGKKLKFDSDSCRDAVEYKRDRPETEEECARHLQWMRAKLMPFVPEAVAEEGLTDLPPNDPVGGGE